MKINKSVVMACWNVLAMLDLMLITTAVITKAGFSGALWLVGFPSALYLAGWKLKVPTYFKENNEDS